MKNNCIICNSNNFNTILEYTNNKIVVTSDNQVSRGNFILVQCKKCFHIQKKTDKQFIDKLNLIYQNYQAYNLTDGEEEQKIDIDDKSTNRSKLIINNIDDLIIENGRILDIGTGTGVFLKEFSNIYNWELYAQDVNSNKKDILNNLDNFKRFFIVNKDKIYEDYFDIISAIHVFEHIIELNQFLEDVKKYLTKTGILLLQVPNIDENIFDIFTFDHISHFTKYTLEYSLKKHFKYIYFPNKQITKEITVIASNSPIKNKTNYQIEHIDIDFKNKIDKLLSYLLKIDNKVAIFGTTPPALFCAAILDFEIEYFLDDNENKQNKNINNKKIISPNNANKDIDILFPYSNDVLNILEKKYPKLNFISLNKI